MHLANYPSQSSPTVFTDEPKTKAHCARCNAKSITTTQEPEDLCNKIEQKHQEWLLALDVVNDPIFLHDKEFRILGCNKAYQQCAGIPFKQIIGQPYYEVFPITHAPLPGCLSAIEKTAAEEEVTVGEAIFRSRAFSIHDEQDAYLYSVHILEDISERLRADRALQESESKFHSIAASAQDAILMMDNEGKIFFWNAAAEKIFGYPAQEAMGQGLHALLAPTRYYNDYSNGFSHFKETGEGPVIGKTIELAALRNGGTEFFIELSLSAIKRDGLWNTIGIIRDITERKQTETDLNRANRALAALGEVNHNLVHATDEHELLFKVCKAIVKQRGYRMAWVGYLEQDEAKTIRPVAQEGFEEGYLDTVKIVYADTDRGRGPTGKAARSGQTQIAQNILTDDRMLPWQAEAAKRGYASSIALPLAINGQVFGVLTIYADQADAFNQAETMLLEEMADDLAFGVRILHTRHERDLALEQNKRQLAQLQDNLEDTVRAIATIVEMRDPYTAGHQAKVADLAVAIAKQMGLPDEQVHGIHLAGVVHDLGKIQIPAEILSKPGRLNEIETSLIKTHPQAGFVILKGINFPWPIAQAVLQHHERLDGSGYPNGLTGDQIIIEARILSVADVVEAVNSHRPYRPALGIDVALKEIEKGRGTLYDEAVADACLKLFREGRFKF